MVENPLLARARRADGLARGSKGGAAGQRADAAAAEAAAVRVAR
jgi:hypothetical protein